MSQLQDPQAPLNSSDNQSKKNNKESKKTFRQRLKAFFSSELASIICALLMPLLTIVGCEWVARGSFEGNSQNNGFFQALSRHFLSFLIAYLLLVFIYIFISHISGQHWLATFLVGLIGFIPAVITYFKLTLRGEPFLPWDITQAGDLMTVSGNLSLEIPRNIIICAVVLLLLSTLSGFVKIPKAANGKPDYKGRLIYSGISLIMCLVLIFGVFLSPRGTAAMGIREDMWMQDRYYRNHGVLTGFLTNLQMLNISKPAGYSTQAVQEIAANVEAQLPGQTPVYSTGYSATSTVTEQQPDILYIMAESFWDVTQLNGITYDQPLLSNITALAAEGAYGSAYTPSLGGGTCDVEFEALTGFSMEFLPAGSKAFQQYVTQPLFSLPNYLKGQGYQTMAIHGYGRKFWNRDQAYPRLGIDEFIAQDDFVNPHKRRGFISDDAMVDMIIQQLEQNGENGPMFIHAVTMQNHTTYNPDRYPAGELVQVTDYPEGLSESVVGQLEDCATGIREMDAALGTLSNYLRTTNRPTILVFWGDHLNPMSDGYTLFSETGMIDGANDITNPYLRQTPLLIWSNYATNQVELGTLATYQLSAVMMDLYGLEKPLLFDFLLQTLPVMRARTRGITVNPDNSTTEAMTAAQQEVFNQHAILQYDFMFGNHLLEDYTEH